MLGRRTKSLVGPSDGRVVDLGTSVADLVSLMEVSELSSTMDLNLLASADLCLDLRGGNWVVTSVKLVQLTINVLRHSNCVESAWYGGVFVTGGRH